MQAERSNELARGGGWNEPALKTLHRVAITVAFSFTCFAVPVMSAAGAERVSESESGSVRVGVPVVGAEEGALAGGSLGGSLGGGSVGGSGIGDNPTTGPGNSDGNQGDGSEPAGGGSGGDGGEGGTLPGGGGVPGGGSGPLGSGFSQLPLAQKAEVLKDLNSLKVELQRQRQELIQRYRELLRGIPDSKNVERGLRREQLIDGVLREFREALIIQQRELRERLEEWRRDHLDLQPLLDQSKEQLKEKVRDRRGIGDN